jgi:WD40 repeat protein
VGQSIKGHDAWISPDGRLFAVVSDTFIRAGRSVWQTFVWDTMTGRLLVSAPGTAASPLSLDPTGRWLAVANAENESIDIYATSDGKRSHNVKLAGLPRDWSGGFPTPIQISPSGDRLSFVHQGVLYLWDAAADRPVTIVDKPGHFGPVRCVTQHAGAQLIASGGTEGVVLLWDRRAGRFLRTLVGHTGEVVAMAFQPDGTRLASASSDGTVILWDVTGQRIWIRHIARTPVIANGLVFDPAGSALLVGAAEGRLLRLDVSSGQVIAEVANEADGLAALALAPDGSSLATASPGGRVTIRDAALKSVRSTWEAGAPIAALAFAGSAGFLATGGPTIDLREAATGRLLFRQNPPRPPVKTLDVDARTGELAFADASGSVQLLSLADLNRAFRDLTLEISGFPFTSSALLPSRVAADVLGEPQVAPAAPRGQANDNTSEPRDENDIPRVRSGLPAIEGLR